MDSNRISKPSNNSSLDNILLLALVVFACSAILEPFANGLERSWWIVRSGFESSAPVQQAPAPAVVPERNPAPTARIAIDTQKKSRPTLPKRPPRSTSPAPER
jgi:hypothetical protein